MGIKIGDKVEVVKYGSLSWKRVKDNYELKPHEFFSTGSTKIVWVDMQPDIIGRIGVVSGIATTQNYLQYSIEGIPEKSAWYSESQLKLIKQS